jgi:hypothetical protein
VPSYDPEVIERFAAQLERRAKAVRRGFTAAGLLIGALFGSFPLTSLGSAWPIPHIFGFTTLLLGAAVGALIGWVVGDGRASMYRMHAQTTLCQLHAQRTTLAIWRLLQERSEAQSAPEIERTPKVESETVPETAPEPKLEPKREPKPRPEPEPEPVFAPAARLAAPPATRLIPPRPEPAQAAEPAPAPAATPVHVRPPALEPLVPLSAPSAAPLLPPEPPSAPSSPAYEQPPAVAAHAKPSAFGPTVQPPPLSD